MSRCVCLCAHAVPVSKLVGTSKNLTEFLEVPYKYTEKDFVRFYVDAKFRKIIFIKSIESGNTVTEIDY